MYQTIRYEKNGNIGIATINRPEALNALNSTVISELEQLISEVEKDAELGASIGKLVRFPQTVPENTASRSNSRNTPFHRDANGFPYLLLLADKKGTSFRTFLFAYRFVLCA